MPMTAQDTANQIWLTALQSPFGVGVVVTDMMRAKAQLYNARKRMIEKGVPGLDKFRIKTSPSNPASQLYIVKDLATQE